MQIVILGGGLATRLRPLTEEIPKALIPIGGRPFICYILNKLISEGFTNFVFCIGFLADSIVEFLNSLHEWRQYFTYSIEEEPLGTGGALLNVYSILEDDFMVLNGDNIWLGNYQSIIDNYYHTKSRALVALRYVENQGNVIFNSNSSKIVHYARNCPDCKYEDIGIKMFNKNIFANCSTNFPISLEDDIYHSLIADNKLNGVLTFDKVLDIGTFEALDQTEQYLSTLNDKGLK